MLLTLAHIGPRPDSEFESLTKVYVQRIATFGECKAEGFRTVKALWEWVDRQPGRMPVQLVLLDSRGKQMTSEAFAAWLGARRDQGARHIVFAIGPADGWSSQDAARAQLLLSLGQFTLAHPLARLVMAEQLYRACTILAGHPYHTGH